jgi:hypothetical protein
VASKNYYLVFHNVSVLGEDKQVKASFTLSYNNMNNNRAYE